MNKPEENFNLAKIFVKHERPIIKVKLMSCRSQKKKDCIFCPKEIFFTISFISMYSRLNKFSENIYFCILKKHYFNTLFCLFLKRRKSSVYP